MSLSEIYMRPFISSLNEIMEKRIDHDVVFFLNQRLLAQLNLEYGKGL